MRPLALFTPVLVAVLVGAGAGAPDAPRKRTPTATPAPEVEASEEIAPTPTPEPPRFLGSLESLQGDGGDRVAVFADGTLVETVRWRERTITRRLSLSREELAVVRRLLAETLAAPDEEIRQGEVLTKASERRMRMEIAALAEGAPPRVFLFDDATALPLLVGRARGALEDLRSRFDSRTPVGEVTWDPSGVATGDRLRRKSDGRWFLVRRDDSFERNLELRTEEGDIVIWVGRDQIPRFFHDPALPSPDPAPVEQPR